MRKTILCNKMYICRENEFGDRPLVFLAALMRVNSDLPLLEPEDWFRKQAQYRHRCRMAPIEVEANTKIRWTLIGRWEPMRGDYFPGDVVHCWKAGQGVLQSQGHWTWTRKGLGC